MELQIGSFYIDNDEVVYRCIALRGTPVYAEAVMEVMGDTSNTMLFCVFYRSNWAWMDRESPDYRLVEEVEYFPHLV
jgi:hypothetical protein